MNKKITPGIISKKTLSANLAPNNFTLTKLKQFARTYTFESSLPEKLNSYIIN